MHASCGKIERESQGLNARAISGFCLLAIKPEGEQERNYKVASYSAHAQAAVFNSFLALLSLVSAIRFLNANVRSEGHISGACLGRLFAPRGMTSRRDFLFTEHLHVARRLFSPLTHRPTTHYVSVPDSTGAEKCNGTTFRFARVCTL